MCRGCSHACVIAFLINISEPHISIAYVMHLYPVLISGTYITTLYKLKNNTTCIQWEIYTVKFIQWSVQNHDIKESTPQMMTKLATLASPAPPLRFPWVAAQQLYSINIMVTNTILYFAIHLYTISWSMLYWYKVRY